MEKHESKRKCFAYMRQNSMSEKNGVISRSKIRRDKLFLMKFILKRKKNIKIKMKYKKRKSVEYEEKLC